MNLFSEVERETYPIDRAPIRNFWYIAGRGRSDFQEHTFEFLKEAVIRPKKLLIQPQHCDFWAGEVVINRSRTRAQNLHIDNHFGKVDLERIERL